MTRPFVILVTLFLAGSVAATPGWLAHAEHRAVFTLRGTIECAPACAAGDADVTLIDAGDLDNSRPRRREAFGHATVRTDTRFRFSVAHEWGRDEVAGEGASLSAFVVTVERVGCEAYEREFRFRLEGSQELSFNLGTVHLDCRRARR
ncbi:MAG TPA: hypothetical protein VJ724_13950 [Tahibacter sp.]|nr:hypothetical protein [Tahibacter sp.]